MKIKDEKDRELHNLYDEHNSKNHSKTGKKSLSKVTLKLVAAAAAVTAVTVISGFSARFKLINIGMTTADINVKISSLSSGEDEQKKLESLQVDYLLEANGEAVKTGPINGKDTLLSFDGLTPDTEYLLSVYSKEGDTASILGTFHFPTLIKQGSLPSSLIGALSESGLPESGAPPDGGKSDDEPPPPTPEPEPIPEPEPTPTFTAPTATAVIEFTTDGVFINVTVTPNDGVVLDCKVDFNGAETAVFSPGVPNAYNGVLLLENCVAGTNTATATVSYTLNGVVGTTMATASFETVSPAADCIFTVSDAGTVSGTPSFVSPNGTIIINPNVTVSHNGAAGTPAPLPTTIATYYDGYDTTVTVTVDWTPSGFIGGSKTLSFTFTAEKD